MLKEEWRGGCSSPALSRFMGRWTRRPPYLWLRASTLQNQQSAISSPRPLAAPAPWRFNSLPSRIDAHRATLHFLPLRSSMLGVRCSMFSPLASTLTERRYISPPVRNQKSLALRLNCLSRCRRRHRRRSRSDRPGRSGRSCSNRRSSFRPSGGVFRGSR